MKIQRSAPITRIILISLCLCASVVEFHAQAFKALKPGIEYAEFTKEIAGLNVNMNLLRLDLTKVRLDVVHAMDSVIGVEKTSSIAERHKAFAAINAGFFRLDTSQWLGDPVGVLQIDGKLLSEPTNDRIQLLINNAKKRTEVYIARPNFTEAVKFGGDLLDLKGINRELKADDIVMYTPEFGKTTLTKNDSIEVSVVGTAVGMTVRDIGNSLIPPTGYVISATGSYRDRLAELAAKNERTMIVRTSTGLPPAAAGTMKLPNEWDIIAGVPLLIRDGKIDITWQQEKSSKSFVETRHPRTAVAKLKDGKFLMVTVDGRSESSGGIGLQDLAEYLLSLGAVDAMNLDGGGSTTMWVDGKVVNHPSDKEGERKVSDVLLVTPRKK